MDFSDSYHSLAGLAFHGATEVDLEQVCPDDLTQMLGAWSDRSNLQSSGSKLLQLDDCSLFSINYEGKARDYWPNESANDISETLIREFLYHNGISALSDERIRLFHARYSIIALSGDEYLVVCPYLTAKGDVSGLVVVTVTKIVRGRAKEQ